MSVYIPKNKKTYVYDFEWRGHRFSGSTGAKSKREAEKIEAAKRKEAEALIAAQQKSSGGLMTLDQACGRYMDEIGQYAKSVSQIEKHLDYLLTHLGENTLLKDITNDDVARLVARRRADRVDNYMKRKKPKDGAERPPAKRISNATTNRSCLEPLKRILLRARDVWGQTISPIEWKKHKLPEPEERVRSMQAEEEIRFFEKLPEPYHPIAYFAKRSGCRAMECINLMRSDVDWGALTFVIRGKGGKIRTLPLPLDVRDVIFPLEPSPDGHVFSLPPTAKKRKDLPRRRMSYRAYYSAVRRALQRAGVKDFRIHDFRHTAGTRLLKETGNLKMVQKLLRHSNIKTTAKYAHVFDEELRDALDNMPKQSVPYKAPQDGTKSLKTNKK